MRVEPDQSRELAALREARKAAEEILERLLDMERGRDHEMAMRDRLISTDRRNSADDRRQRRDRRESASDRRQAA